MVALAGIHSIIPPSIKQQVEITTILIPTRIKGNGYQTMMTAPSMGQFTSGADVTKTNMVTISGPAVLSIAIQLTFHPIPIIRQEGGMTQHLHLKYISLTKRHHQDSSSQVSSPSNHRGYQGYQDPSNYSDRSHSDHHQYNNS